jgi:hypothetical protein
MGEGMRLVRAQRAFRRAMLLIAAGRMLAACGHDAENAAQSARILLLEQEVRRLGASVSALHAGAAAKPSLPPSAAGQSKPFTIECPQPWLLHPPLGATLWNCRSPKPTPEGLYPQCSIVVQPQVAIETQNYFEFAWNASPQLQQVKNIKDRPIKIKDHDGFEATYESEPKPVPMKMRSVLIPHGEQVYAVTCFAPSVSFDNYDAKAFQKITSTIAFPSLTAK